MHGFTSPPCSPREAEDEKLAAIESYAELASSRGTGSTSASSSGELFDDSDTASEADVDAQFYRHRPTLHLMPHAGWMNDPCGLGWDAHNEVYTVSVQWNPHGSDWGNMSWCHAVSRDLVSWTVGTQPSIAPTRQDDVCGVFTGCLWSQPGSEELTAFYTSAQDFPIHWTKDYVHGSEKLHMATSADGGRTWVRSPANPLLSGPPAGLKAKGWRDPFLGSWPALDACLGTSEPRTYGLLAGSVEKRAPAVFLYAFDRERPTRWDFLGTLEMPAMNWSLSRRLPDFGTNWEVTNFATLPLPHGDCIDVLVTGVEGCLPWQGCNPAHLEHRQMWLSVELDCHRSTTGADGAVHASTEDRTARQLSMRVKSGGCLDWGLCYACNSFTDPASGELVLFGWVLEKDLSDARRTAQGWAGCLTVPRVLRAVQVDGIVAGHEGIDWLQLDRQADGSLSMTTVAMLPHASLTQLRDAEVQMSADGIDCRAIEINASLAVDANLACGIVLHHGDECYTIISYDHIDQRFTVDRSRSTSLEGVDTSSERASHAIFDILQPAGHDGSADNAERGGSDKLGSNSKEQRVVKRETLDLHILFDVSVLEIFVNDRTTLTTRIYPPSGLVTRVQPLMGSSVQSSELYRLRPADNTYE